MGIPEQLKRKEAERICEAIMAEKHPKWAEKWTFKYVRLKRP